MPSIEVFEVAPDQWAYRVGHVYQEWHPGLCGFVPMSEAEATELANGTAQRLAE